MAKKPVKFSVLNAFTETAFKGNPVAVCLLEEERSGMVAARAVEFHFYFIDFRMQNGKACGLQI